MEPNSNQRFDHGWAKEPRADHLLGAVVLVLLDLPVSVSRASSIEPSSVDLKADAIDLLSVHFTPPSRLERRGQQR